MGMLEIRTCSIQVDHIIIEFVTAEVFEKRVHNEDVKVHAENRTRVYSMSMLSVGCKFVHHCMIHSNDIPESDVY